MKLEIAGTSGVIDYDSAKDAPLVSMIRGSSFEAAGVTVPESPLEQSPYYRELEHFFSCIRQGSDPLVSAEDAYEALRIALAALTSMSTGQPVVLQAEACV